MYSKVKIKGHPVHPMLVSFPIVFYTSTLVAYVIYALSESPFWFRVGLAANLAGIVMALIAATFGFLDWYLGIPSGSEAFRTGLIHMLLNVTSVLLFIIVFGLNIGEWSTAIPNARGSIILPLTGFLCTLGAGYFGFELVQKHHVGVEFTNEEESCMREVGRYGKHSV